MSRDWMLAAALLPSVEDRMQRQLGLTVIELMVALAVAAVLIGIAAPAFNDFVAQRTLRTQANDFVMAVQLARSEALRRGDQVSLQAIDASAAANEWGPGWCIVAGNPGACPNDGTEIRVFPPLGGNSLDGAGALNTVGALTFNPRGLLVGLAGGTLDLCDAAVNPDRRITLSAIGRVSVSNVNCP